MINPYLDMSYDNFNIDRDQEDNEFLKRAVASAYLNNSPNPSSVVISKPEAVRQEPARQEDPLANIRVLAKPPVPANFGMSQPEQNLKQAEEELNQAKIEDAQTGSEGYENKEDGVFNRIKNWGSSVSDYLFGKEKSTAETPMPFTSDALKNVTRNIAANQIVSDLNDRAEEQAKEEQGILGYYGNKLTGKQGQREWEDFKKDWGERGIGALTGRAANLMETMAKSPYASMVDPTTVLGGQRTMVNDIDSYFDKRGLGALRNDLLKQDLLYGQTKMGQAERFANMPPEQQEKVLQGLQAINAKTGSTNLPKNAAEGAYRAAQDYRAQGLGSEDAYQRAADDWGVTPEEAKAGRPIIRRATQNGLNANDQLAYDQAVRDVMVNPDAYPGDAFDDKVFNAYAGNKKKLMKDQYQALSGDEKAEARGLYNTVDKFTKEDGIADNIIQNGADAAINIPAAEVALNVIERYPNFTGGGTFGETVQNIMTNASFQSDEEAQKAAAALNVALKQVYKSEMAKVIEKLNKGSISDSERRLFDSLVANLGDSPQELMAKLRLFKLMNMYAAAKQEELYKWRDLPYKQQYEKMREFENNNFGRLKELAEAALTGTRTRRTEDATRDVF